MAVDLNQLEITVAQLEEDATVIGKIVNDAVDAPNAGEADGTVTTRLGDVVKNVNRVLADLTASNPVADLSNSTTTDLAEGTNLYYTQGRFDTALTAKSTTDLSEGTNLYYTQGRFDTALTAKSTTDLSEGTNLYYTQGRLDTAFTAKSTTDLSEGTNLYYTDERVDDRVNGLLVAGDGITLAYDDGANTLTVDAAIPAITTISTSRTLALTDASDILEIDTSGGGIIVTIPLNATVPFPIGTVINFTLIDASNPAVITAPVGGTLNGIATGAGAILSVQYNVVSMYKRATDAWVISGDMGTISNI